MTETTSKRQHEIIEAAGKLLMEKGVKGVTTKNLAIEMGFTESALYRHFKNKEDIIVLLLNYLNENIRDRLDVIQNNNNISTEKLNQIFQSQFRYFSENPHFIVAILSEGLFDETEKINSSILKIITYKMQLISGIIDQGKDDGEFTTDIPTSDMVHIVMGSFRLMMLKWKLSKFELNLIQQGTTIMTTVLNLMKK